VSNQYLATRIQGVAKLRRTFNRLEKVELVELRAIIKEGAMDIKRDGIANAITQDIKLTGEMIASIDYKLSGDKLTAVIGPAAKEAKIVKNRWNTAQFSHYKRESTKVRKKAAQWNLMKAWWAEFGTAGPIEQQPMPFMNPAFYKNEAQISAKARRAQAMILKKASS